MISLIYCFLLNKAKNIYTKALNALEIDKCNAKTIIIDF